MVLILSLILVEWMVCYPGRPRQLTHGIWLENISSGFHSYSVKCHTLNTYYELRESCLGRCRCNVWNLCRPTCPCNVSKYVVQHVLVDTRWLLGFPIIVSMFPKQYKSSLLHYCCKRENRKTVVIILSDPGLRTAECSEPGDLLHKNSCSCICVLVYIIRLVMF